MLQHLAGGQPAIPANLAGRAAKLPLHTPHGPFDLTEELASCQFGVVRIFGMQSDDRCAVLSVTLVHCGQTVGWIKMKAYHQTN